MDKESEDHLQTFYRKHNANLAKLLPTLDTEIPEWLQNEQKEGDVKD